MIDEMSLFWEIHEDLPQQGPGDNDSTIIALNTILESGKFNKTDKVSVLDIGCGPGRQTIAIAKNLNCKITAIDNHQPFLDEVNKRALKNNLLDKVVTLNQSMDNIKLEGFVPDIIWSEGAIYIMGFEKGLNYWKTLLKPGGNIAVSEISWFTNSPEKELKEYWNENYSAMKSIDENITIIDNCGLKLINNFKIPYSSWADNYYKPIEERISKLRDKYKDNNYALEFFDNYYNEIDIFKKYSDSYGYVFYIMQSVE